MDDVHNYLNIDHASVRVMNNGIDVTSMGELSISGQKITFEFNQVDSSFSYLADQTYTLQFYTTIKSSVTNNQLKDITALQKGIPNQAEVVVDNTKTFKSNVPRIIPETTHNIVPGKLPITGLNMRTELALITLFMFTGVGILLKRKYQS